MTGWQLFCAIHFATAGTLTVLGPKCRTAECPQPATHRVHWPSGPFVACERCTARWQSIAEPALGMHLVVDELHYLPGGLDDTEQRFAQMELE